MKTALTIAGSDCTGGAGIQADLKTFSANGVFGMSVIVSVVAENTARVLAIENVSPEHVLRQMDAVFEDIPPDAVKIGMLADEPRMRAVAEGLKKYRPEQAVLDPVMYAKNGCPLMSEDSVECLIREVLPLAALVTPNLPEAERLAGIPVRGREEMQEAAKRIYAMGVPYVLVKGGHAAGDAADLLYDGYGFTEYVAKRVNTKNTHGTGCTFSSAIAANLAKGLAMEDAVDAAKRYVTEAITHALELGKGCGPTHHFYGLYRAAGMENETK